MNTHTPPSASNFNEDTRVKIPAIVHLTRLGYRYISLKNQKIDKETNIFDDIFITSLKKLNPQITDREVTQTLNDLKLKLTFNDLGEKFFEEITKSTSPKIIDLENFENNTLNVATELTYEAKNGDKFRVDIAIIINGLPLVFAEVKKPNNESGIEAEEARMEKRFSNTAFKNFANLTQMMVFSNNMEYSASNRKQGVFYASSSYGKVILNRFRDEEQLAIPHNINPSEERLILSDNNRPTSFIDNPEYQTNRSIDRPTNRILTSLLSPDRLAFILKHGIVYVRSHSGIQKHIMRYPQLFASKALIKFIDSNRKSGIIWHTQGSGKTALTYFSAKILTEYFSKKGIIPKFYFIVDRLDLLEQAKREFSSRGIHVNTISSKRKFLNTIKSQKAYENDSGKIEITVTNIHKFDEADGEHLPNDYDAKIQRVYFIDEAHRSYSDSGSFLKNLITSDRDAIKIALTGTPLLKKKKATSRQIFGDYIHKYYYNQSIEDGYTLRLIREDIEISHALKIRDSFKMVKKGSLSKTEILADDRVAKPMVDFIAEDIIRTRRNHADDTIGGMVVCQSAQQARSFFEIFKKAHPDLRGQLILSNHEDNAFRKEEKEKFVNGEIDILFVYNMLLTGFDAPRLKKLYLARVVKDHNLLQTLTRVNRPYRNFRFGYIVDFAGIQDEFDKTNYDYFKEFQGELGDDYEKYSNIMLSQVEIEKELRTIFETLSKFTTNNAEIFSDEISQIEDKNHLYNLKDMLERARELYNVAKVNDFSIKDLISDDYIVKFLKITKDRINFLRSTEERPSGEGVVPGDEIIDAVFDIRKIGANELELGKIKDTFETIKKSFGELSNLSGQPEYITLQDEFARIFAKFAKRQDEINFRDNPDIQTLQKIVEQLKNLENRERSLRDKYGGDRRFVEIHRRLKDIFAKTVSAPSDQPHPLEKFLKNVQSEISRIEHNNEDIIKHESLLYRRLQPIIYREILTNHREVSDAQIINNITKIIIKNLKEGE